MKKYLTFLFALICISGHYAQTLKWTDPVDVADESFGHFYPRIVISNDKPIVSWGHEEEIYISRETAQGFSAPIQINDINTQAFAAGWTGADLAADGNLVYATFMHQDWGAKTYLVRSVDGGASFTAPMLIENYADSTSRFPTVAIDADGHPIVAIMKMTSVGSHPHYVVRVSNDYGNSFYKEHDMAAWSGTESEACDCCPATIKINEDRVAVYFRNNINHIREVWVGLSEDNGENFETGFEVDDSEWFIQGCPSSGPDGIIYNDKLYSVYLSDGRSYLSRTDFDTGDIEDVMQLGGDGNVGSQNFPRMDNNGSRTGVVWKQLYGGSFLIVNYYEDIEDESTSIIDTVYMSSFANADIALSSDAIHIVWQNTASGTVKYIKGSMVSSVEDDLTDQEVSVYPNPCRDIINIEGAKAFDILNIYNLLGEKVVSQELKNSVDVSQLMTGNYILELVDKNKRKINLPFCKE